MKRLKFGFFILLSGTCQSVVAQSFYDDLRISANYHYGYVIPEYSNILLIVNKPVQSVSISASKKTIGKTIWEKIYNYPEFGGSIFYTTLGNDKVHGRELAIYPWVRMNILSKGGFSFFNQTGIGASYVTRKFDLNNNYLNVAVGSHLNIHFSMKFGLAYEVKKVQFNAGVSFDHFSNGNLSEPNLGLNFLTSYAGIDYLLGKTRERLSTETTPRKKGFSTEAIYSVGRKHPRALNNQSYFTSSLTIEEKWRCARTINLGLGVDVFYDASTPIEMTSKGLNDYQPIDKLRTGIHISQEFIYDRVSVILQEGVYLGLVDEVTGKVMYNRGVVRYRFNDHALIQVAMKSHLNILDFPELGFGWKW